MSSTLLRCCLFFSFTQLVILVNLLILNLALSGERKRVEKRLQNLFAVMAIKASIEILFIACYIFKSVLFLNIEQLRN